MRTPPEKCNIYAKFCNERDPCHLIFSQINCGLHSMYLATAWGRLVNNPLTNGRLMGIMCISDEALVSFFNISCQSKQQWLLKIVVNAQSKIWVNYNIPDLYTQKTMFMPWQLTARGVDCMFIFGTVDQNRIQQRCSCLLLSVCQFSACEFQHCWLYVSYQHCWL